ncbi:MAG TPA: DUF1772 domain-containing protein [Vicinamibacterales bacterium]|jgi:cytochrome bd-type quinol oxidase subunit 2|nr:DUF1772 domain-containing protein [Vicinamibacterales bacterium]
MRQLARVVLLLSAGLLAGATVTVALLEHAFAGSAPFFTEFKQLEIRAFTVPLPAIGLVAVIFGIVHATLERPNRAALALTTAGVACLILGAAITMRGHFPINERVKTWSAAAPPVDWAAVQERWRQYHDARTIVVVLGFTLLILGTRVRD